MPKPRTALKNLRVDEVSFVPSGDNGPARIVLVKRAPAPGPGLAQRFRDAVASVRKVLGREPGAAVRKELYEDVRARESTRGAAEVLLSRVQALCQSLESILWFSPMPAEGEGGEPAPDTEALVRQTVRQFADAIDAEAADVLAGRITKRLEKMRAADPMPPDPAALEAAVREVLKAEPGDAADAAAAAEPQPDAGTPPAREEPKMRKDLAGVLAALTPEDRATVEASIKKSEPAPPDPAAAGELVELRKQLTEGSAENAALRLRVEKMEHQSARTAFRKQVEFAALPVSADELCDVLLDLPEPKRDAIVKVLGAANQAAGRAALYAPLGSDTAAPGSAEAQVNALAKELQKSQPALSIEQARTAVLKADPDLYVRLDAEGRAAAHQRASQAH